MVSEGLLSIYSFSPVVLTYAINDQGSWKLNGQTLVLDCDLDKRIVEKKFTNETQQLLAQKQYLAVKQFADKVKFGKGDKIELVVVNPSDKGFELVQAVNGSNNVGICTAQ